MLSAVYKEENWLIAITR